MRKKNDLHFVGDMFKKYLFILPKYGILGGKCKDLTNILYRFFDVKILIQHKNYKAYVLLEQCVFI